MQPGMRQPGEEAGGAGVAADRPAQHDQGDHFDEPVDDDLASALASFRFDLERFQMFDLDAQDASFMTLICFYRGAHCAICRRYLLSLAALVPQFSARGVKVIAVSMDTVERARLTQDLITAEDLPVGYALTVESARNWA